MRKFILQHRRAPGDIVATTALIRDLKLTYGDKIRLDVRVSWPALYEHNPHIEPMRSRVDKPVDVVLKYRAGITESNNGAKLHFAAYFHKYFKEQTGIDVPVHYAKPDLHLSKFEQSVRPIAGRYWVVFGGGKPDITVKHWRYAWYQEVVNKLKDRGIACVQSGAAKQGHVHPPMDNVLNLVGWGSMREWLWQIYHADGVICPITGAMHVSAAFEKPCVVIAGGREAPAWEWYGHGSNFGRDAVPIAVPHRYLHTVNQLPCCMNRGCWKSFVLKEQAGSKHNKICERVLAVPGEQALPECMNMITPDNVVDAVMSYYEDGTLTMPSSYQLPTLSAKTSVAVPVPVPPPAPKAHKSVGKEHVFDHPEIGGKLTVCLLCYGDYTHLVERSINTLLGSIDPDRLELRVACNQVCDKTLAYLDTVPIAKKYINEHNEKKYPVMRAMLNDVTAPIDTRYFMWLDDDTYVVNKSWHKNLGETIIENRAQNVGAYGDIRYHRLAISPSGYDQRDWFRSAPWYRREPFCDRKGNLAPNGEFIKFPVGWCWVMKTEAARVCQIPDSRIGHNGDMAAGAALVSNGYALKQWNLDKSLIATIPPGNRRGLTEQFPWKKL